MLSINELLPILIILLVCIVGTMVLIYTYESKLKKSNIEKGKIASALTGKQYKSKFEEDIKFLQYLVSHKIRMNKKFLLEPSRMTKTSIITDDEFDEYQAQIVEEVTSSLSEEYINVLLCYFNREALNEYIIEIVLSTYFDECKVYMRV